MASYWFARNGLYYILKMMPFWSQKFNLLTATTMLKFEWLKCAWQNNFCMSVLFIFLPENQRGELS